MYIFVLDKNDKGTGSNSYWYITAKAPTFDELVGQCKCHEDTIIDHVDKAKYPGVKISTKKCTNLNNGIEEHGTIYRI